MFCFDKSYFRTSALIAPCHEITFYRLMHLSRFSDYSLRVLMFAALKDESFQIDEVTAAYDISRNHLAKVINELAKLGYLKTRRGRGGGTQLGRQPETVAIGTLLRHTEGRSTLVECFDPATNTCSLIGCCKLKGLLAEAQNAFYDSLDQYTLEDLVSGPQCRKMTAILLNN